MTIISNLENLLAKLSLKMAINFISRGFLSGSKINLIKSRLGQESIYFLRKSFNIHKNDDKNKQSHFRNFNNQQLPQNTGMNLLHGSHNKLWIIEKAVTASFIIVMPATILCPSFFGDVVFSTLLTFHHYVGIEAILADYVRAEVVGLYVSKFCTIFNIISSLLILFALISFSKKDMPFGYALRYVWGKQLEAE